MTLFDLIFLVAALTTLITLILIVVAALRGRGARALTLLTRLGIGAVGYLAAGLIVSVAQHQRRIAPAEPWCFDDWCLTLDHVGTTRTDDGSIVTTEFRIASQARRISQHANGAWIYLLDAGGHRYAPIDDAADVPLTVQLGPGESVPASRRFRLPGGVTATGLITGHGGPYCGMMSFLVIGSAGCVFGRPTMIVLPGAG